MKTKRVRRRLRPYAPSVRDFVLRSRAQVLVRPFINPMQWLTWSTRFFDWIDEHKDESTALFAERFQLHEHCIVTRGLADQPIDYLEFGVRVGRSLRWWVNHNTHPDTRFYGFDTFTGIPEDSAWAPAGTFSTDSKLPDIDDPRIRYQVGLFQETLVPFLEQFKRGRRVVVHIDADLYSSTLYALSNVGPRLEAGDLVVFDEAGAMIGFTHEFRALVDYSSAFQKQFRLIGGARGYSQLALEVL